MLVRFSFPNIAMRKSSVKLKSNPEEDSHDMSLNNSTKSPVKITRIKGLSPSDNLLKQCEILSRNNLSEYDNCVKLQEKLRLHLTNNSMNDDHQYLKSWLGKAREDYITMESNYGDLKDIYEVLLKNNFVEKFYDYGETLDKLQLKFLKVMVQCKDLQISLNSVESDITSLKSEYKKSSATEEPLKYTSHQKTLRLKAINIIYECERLNSCVEEISEKIVKLNSEYDNLIGRYGVLSQSTIVKEFLDSANQQEKLQMKSAKRFNKGECSKTVLGESNREVASLQKLCMAEQRRREEIEKAYSSLDEFSDKICRMLLHHQRQILSNKKTNNFLTNNESIRSSIKKESEPCDTNASAEFSSSTILQTNISELEEDTDGNSQDENKFPLHTVYVPDNTIEDSVDISLDSGITAVGNSTELETSPDVEKVTDFRCNFCKGYFASQQILHDHKRIIHEGHKPYSCFVCGKLFIYRSNMKKHLMESHRRVNLQTTSGKKPHKCSMCPMRFKHYREKTQHQREAHKN